MSNLKTRCIGAAFVALFVLLMFVHPYALYFCYLFLGACMLIELGNAVHLKPWIAISFHSISLALMLWKGESGLLYWFILLLSFTIIRAVIVSSRGDVNPESIENMKLSLMMSLYITGFFSPIVFFSWRMIALLLLLSFGTDTFAYFIGCLYGKRKLCPAISPNKSVEGAIGGVLGAAVLGALWTYFMLPGTAVGFYFYLPVLSILSECGDLFASIIKRKHGIKDYSNLIPGHGGVLDRFDSVLFVTAILYVCYHINL